MVVYHSNPNFSNSTVMLIHGAIVSPNQSAKIRCENRLKKSHQVKSDNEN